MYIRRLDQSGEHTHPELDDMMIQEPEPELPDLLHDGASGQEEEAARILAESAGNRRGGRRGAPAK